MAVGFPTKANWASGDVLTAAQMDDLAGTVNLLSTTRPLNPVLNSNMSVWQRGTSAAGSYPTYLADRWMNYRSTTGSTFSRQSTNDTTNLPNIQYCQRIQRDSGNTSTAGIYISQSLETVNSRPFAGQAVTLSWYARAGANFSAASSNMTVELTSGTGTDQNVIAGFTGASSVISTTKSITTTWVRYSVTGTVPATSTQLGINLYFIPVGTASTNDYMEITGVQLELGSTASTYYPNGNTYQAELAACQRYYYRLGKDSNYSPFGSGSVNSSTLASILVKNPTTMRTIASTLDFGGTIQVLDSAGSTYTTQSPTYLAIASGQSNTSTTLLAAYITGATAGRYCELRAANDATAYIGLSAEL